MTSSAALRFPVVQSSTWRWLLAGSGMIGLILGGIAVFQRVGVRGDPRNSSTISARAAAPPLGVGALGRLEPGWKVFVMAPATSPDGARVHRLLVEEGDLVEAGSLLAVLDTQDRRRAALEEANASLKLAEAKLAEVVAGTKPQELLAQEALIDQLASSLASSEAYVRRSGELLARKVVSGEEYEQKVFQLEMARSGLRQAQAKLESLRHVQPEAIAVARAEVDKSRAGVARAQADLEATNIRSPIAARILKVSARPGEKIGDEGLLELGDTDHMHAVAEVYEQDVARVRIGQPATARLQGSSVILNGTVRHVGWRVGRRVVLDNDPVKDTDARVVEVRVELDRESSAHVAGLSNVRVEVFIQIGAQSYP